MPENPALTPDGKWPEARTGLEWWDGGSGGCPLMASCAPQSGLVLAREKPRAAATAIFRIEALAAESFAKPFEPRGTGETENTV